MNERGTREMDPGWERPGDLQNRIDAVRPGARITDQALLQSAYDKRWWSDLSLAEQEAILRSELG